MHNHRTNECLVWATGARHLRMLALLLLLFLIPALLWSAPNNGADLKILQFLLSG